MLGLLSNIPVDSDPLHYTYNIVNVYPHDESAFTQGLVFENSFLYEGTGLYGQSTLRRVELETGNIPPGHHQSAVSVESHLTDTPAALKDTTAMSTGVAADFFVLQPLVQLARLGI